MKWVLPHKYAFPSNVFWEPSQANNEILVTERKWLKADRIIQSEGEGKNPSACIYLEYIFCFHRYTVITWIRGENAALLYVQMLTGMWLYINSSSIVSNLNTAVRCRFIPPLMLTTTVALQPPKIVITSIIWARLQRGCKRELVNGGNWNQDSFISSDCHGR